MEKFSLEKAQEEATKMQEKHASGEVKDYSEAERQVRYEGHIQELRNSGLYGLEGRVRRGLDDR